MMKAFFLDGLPALIDEDKRRSRSSRAQDVEQQHEDAAVCLENDFALGLPTTFFVHTTARCYDSSSWKLVIMMMEIIHWMLIG